MTVHLKVGESERYLKEVVNPSFVLKRGSVAVVLHKLNREEVVHTHKKMF